MTCLPFLLFLRASLSCLEATTHHMDVLVCVHARRSIRVEGSVCSCTVLMLAKSFRCRLVAALRDFILTPFPCRSIWGNWSLGVQATRTNFVGVLMLFPLCRLPIYACQCIILNVHLLASRHWESLQCSVSCLPSPEIVMIS